MEAGGDFGRCVGDADAYVQRADGGMVFTKEMGAGLISNFRFQIWDLDASAGEDACAEGGLEVVAADGAVEIEDFTGEVQAGDELAFHRAAIDFAEQDAAGGDFCFGKAASAGDGNGGGFHGSNQGDAGSFGKFAQASFWRSNARILRLILTKLCATNTAHGRAAPSSKSAGFASRV